MSEQSQRESFDRRQAQMRLYQWYATAAQLVNAEAAVAKARALSSGEWSKLDLAAFDDIKSMLTDLRSTAEHGVKTETELLAEDAPNQQTHGSLR
jgi:hypothetical protein